MTTIDDKATEQEALAEKKETGRPTLRTNAVIEKICERISCGETLREICREQGMPHWTTVYDWITADKELSLRFVRARETGFDAIAQDALRIADTPLIGEETEETDDGKIKTKRGDMLGHRKLQIETRLKLLAKWDPKRYGDKVDVNHGGQPDNPFTAFLSGLDGKVLGVKK